MFRKGPLSILCLECAEKGGVKYRTSQRWEKAQAKRTNKKKRARQMELRRREAEKLDELAERRRRTSENRDVSSGSRVRRGSVRLRAHRNA